MQVFFDPCSAGVTQVETNVESLGAIELDQNPNAFLDQEHHFSKLLRRKLFQSIGVLIRDDHHMPAGVWIKIQDDKVVLSPMHDQVSKTVQLFLCFAESAWTVLVSAKVFVTVAVDVIHRTILS